MKKAIVYYSLEGNTKFAVKKIAEILDADLIELIPKKEYPKKGFAKYLHGGKAALAAEEPELKPYQFHVDDYDLIIIACPVWASHCAAPINTFLSKYKDDLIQKGVNHIAIVLCQKGKGAQKVLEYYKQTLQVQDFAAELILYDPLSNQDKLVQNISAIDVFCKKLQSLP